MSFYMAYTEQKKLGGFHKEMEILQMKLESLHEKANQNEKNAIEEFHIKM